MTASELAHKAKQDKPHVRYAYNIGENGQDAVAGWNERLGRWQPVAYQFEGKWYSLAYEVLIHDQPMIKEWIEV